MEDHTEPDGATHAAEDADAHRPRSADRPATQEEVTLADEQYGKSDAGQRRSVAEHEEEMMNIGAKVKGEGAIE